MGKGDSVRPHNKKRYDENFLKAFGERPLKTWDPEKDCECKGKEFCGECLHESERAADQAEEVEPEDGGEY